MKFHQPYSVKSAHRQRLSRLGVGVLLVLASTVLTPIAGEGFLQSEVQSPQLPPAATPPPEAGQQPKLNEEQAKAENLETVNAERKRQLGEQSAALLKLATDLKIEVDMTSKDTLSLDVIRKADEIEKLAHEVKEKMKHTMGSN